MSEFTHNSSDEGGARPRVSRSSRQPRAPVVADESRRPPIGGASRDPSAPVGTSDGDRLNTDPRFSRRRQAIARLRRRKIAGRAALVVGAALTVWLAFFSPLLSVTHIEVVGARHVRGDDIASVAGLRGDSNLLRLSTAEVGEAVKTLSWVKTARVDRKLPGTIRVEIVERAPAVALSVAGGRWTIDRRGYVLAPGAPARLPALAGVGIHDVAVGDRVASDEVTAALAVYRALPHSLRRRLEAAFAPTPERISLSLESGLLIRFGAAERLRAKSSVLTALVQRMRRQGIVASYVDVRVPTSPALGPLRAGPPRPLEGGRGGA